MLTFDDPLWEKLNCRWGNALGTSVLIQSWAWSRIVALISGSIYMRTMLIKDGFGQLE